MEITYFDYNTFVIRSNSKVVAIDPGGSFYFFHFFRTLIPEELWEDITHIIPTHGDPDHYWHTDRVAEASGAAVICNERMTKIVDGKRKIIGPRKKGLQFTWDYDNLHTLKENETIEADGLKVTGHKSTHGTLSISFGLFEKHFKPTPGERVGLGQMAFEFELEGKSLINLGDSLLEEEAWQKITPPDVLMIPFAGINTMDYDEALQAIQIIKPKHVIPCHHNCAALFKKNANPADAEGFKADIEALGIQCHLMKPKETITL